MFSLREITDDQFIYRCHECGWESETMTKQQAIEYARSHKCKLITELGPALPPINKPPAD